MHSPSLPRIFQFRLSIGGSDYNSFTGKLKLVSNSICNLFYVYPFGLVICISIGVANSSFCQVLVLGREKEGIPVDIIHILDACIEIPQFGVVRSLNVHVSGAIALWEYTRQQRSQ